MAITRYTMLRVWPTFPPTVRWIRLRALGWIVWGIARSLPRALWYHWHSPIRHQAIAETYWLDVGCNGQRWFRF
jgi:hypothetical protein